jgi:hypothetical protein
VGIGDRDKNQSPGSQPGIERCLSNNFKSSLAYRVVKRK